MKRFFIAFLLALTLGTTTSALACTNFIITKGASTDGSILVSYAADSHQLYGCLYKYNPLKKMPKMMPVTEWDTGKYMGDIPTVATTYSTVGNMNEHSLIITETTFGGREELVDEKGIMDYGSLIYIALQRAKTAREAITVIADLANRYGYYSSGESFSLVDKNEAWIMELIGKGSKLDDKGNNLRKGIVWVARRVPEGYVSGHANQARITTFPLNDKENCLYSSDVISFAREMGYFNGKDEEFSFCDAYAPLDFGAMRACDARIWAFFRTITEGMDQYTDYAMGHNPSNRMPLWVKPTHKISPKQVFDAMRDHYEGTPMDMTTDIGAGGNECPYRWRPMYFKVDGVQYCNERATATQQTGFWLCGQAREGKTGILWFGTDDAATSPLTPIYCNTTEGPWCFDEANGSLLHYSPTSMFWVTNRIAQLAYLRYNIVGKRVREEVDKWENEKLAEVEKFDAKVAELPAKKAQKLQTAYSTLTAQALFEKWDALDKYLLVKYIDGNVKAEDEKGFIENGNGKNIPDKVGFPGYTEKWKRAVAEDNGEVLKVVNY